MNIGIDFDGVISDSTRQKQDYAKRHLGVSLEPEECAKGRAVAAGKMTGEQYEEMTLRLYATPVMMDVARVPHARSAIKLLRQKGHKVFIITSRTEEKVGYALGWLKENHLEYDGFVNTSEMPKLDACKKFNIHAYIEDSPSKLKPLVGQNIKLFLLDAPWNRGTELPQGAKRLKNWKDLYLEVLRIREPVPRAHLARRARERRAKHISKRLR